MKGPSGIGASGWHLPTGGDTIHMTAAAVAVTPRRGETEAGAVQRALARRGGDAALYKERLRRLTHPSGGGSGQRTRGFSEAAGTTGEGGAAPGGGPGGHASLAAPVPASRHPCQPRSTRARLTALVPGS